MQSEKNCRDSHAFTLAEVLITLGIIGVVASLTIPNVMNYFQEREMVTRLLKFNSTLQQAVQMWKQDIDCYSDAYTCLAIQGLPDNACSNFDQIGKFMKISEKTTAAGQQSTANWLAPQTLNYYGEDQDAAYGGVSQKGAWVCAYALSDGQTMAIDPNAASFTIIVDVNGKKLPNRVGKDTFHFIIGTKNKPDIIYYPTYYLGNFKGLCRYGTTCNSDNTDPTKFNGASPTAYVISHQKLPDFKALSQSIEGFKP